PQELGDFLERVSAALAVGDHFLLGIDLVKDVRTLEAAYNDRAGVTAAFTRNLFARMNRELGTQLDLEAIEHVAHYNDRLDRIETLDDADLVRQVTPILSPVVWDLGHIANFEEQWSIRALDPTAPADFVRDRIYDPIANPRPTRKHLALGDRAACVAYLGEVRQRARHRLAQLDLDASDPLLADGYIYKMIAQHEAQHSETILQAVQLMAGIAYEPG